MTFKGIGEEVDRIMARAEEEAAEQLKIIESHPLGRVGYPVEPPGGPAVR